MARVIVVDNDNKISSDLINRLNESSMVEECQIAPGLNGDFTSLLAEGAIDTIIYSPQLQPNNGMSPDLAEAETVLEGCTHAGIQKVVLLSSAAIYGASPYNPGLISESRSLSLKGNNPIEWCAVHQALSSIYRQQDGRTLGGSFGHFLAVGIDIAVARYPGNFQVWGRPVFQP